MTGPSSTRLSERLAERRKEQLGELESLTQQQLSEHETVLRRLLSDARRTTESAIQGQNERLTRALSEAETRQKQQIGSIEQRLEAAATQAERLSRVGGIRSWMRPLAITAAVMLAVGALTVGGLAVADRVIDNRIQKLSILRDEIERAESLPRVANHLEIQNIGGETYVIGDPRVGKLDDGTQVISLTEKRGG